jgi:pyridoxal/pyridoxine/pyridoxamine kinase
MLNKNQIPYFTGTGDLLAAMLLAHEEKNENDLVNTSAIQYYP